MRLSSESNQFLSTPLSVIVGSIIIALSILMVGGVISFKDIKYTAKNSPQVAGQAIQPTPAPETIQQPKQTSVTLDTIKDVLGKSFIKFGNGDRNLIFVIVSDPSCPYCQAATGKNPELNKQMGSQFILSSDGGSYIPPVPEIEKLVKEGKAALSYLYFPGHGNGEMGAKALYCAFEQNKFWEAHDLLMSGKGYDLLNNTIKNDKTKSGELADFLQPVLDSGLMKTCLEGGKYDNRLKDDMALAQKLDIRGTPGFYVNTTPFSGAYSYKDMEPIINSFLK